MSHSTLRFSLLVAGIGMLVPMLGCIVAADVLNPDFLSAVGLDPATVIPSEGRLLVAFQNSTQATADFRALLSEDFSSNAAEQTQVIAIGVAASETRTLVIDCPVGDFLPLEVLVVVSEGAATQVQFVGTPLRSGVDFRCGDVIEMSVVQFTDAEGNVTYRIEAQVLPGR